MQFWKKKTMEKVRKHRYIKFVTTSKRRHYLMSELKLLLNAQMIFKMFIKILKNTIQEKTHSTNSL